MVERRALCEWVLNKIGFTQILALSRPPAPDVAAPDNRTSSARDRDARVIDRIPAALRAEIVSGRAALAEAASAANTAQRDALLAENSPTALLLALLWHADPDVRRAAAHALPGGDRVQAHVPHYGHFVGAFLRGLAEVNERHANPVPACHAERYDRVTRVLHALLDQNIGEIRGLSNMNYSFLSSALYLAVLATCRDVVGVIGRLRVVGAQDELCRLLVSLAQISVLRCFNGQDLEMLATAAGKALAALPPDQIPDFWHSLSHQQETRRMAVAPALNYFQDQGAVPFLLEALNVPGGQPAWPAQRIVACLGRLEDVRALPALAALACGGDRKLRAQARAAGVAIQRATQCLPSQTLLRAAQETDTWDSETMLRSHSVNNHESDAARELLRVSKPACTPMPPPWFSNCQASPPVRERHHE